MVKYNPENVELFLGGMKVIGFSKNVFIGPPTCVVEIDFEQLATDIIDQLIEINELRAAMATKWKRISLYQNNGGDYRG